MTPLSDAVERAMVEFFGEGSIAVGTFTWNGGSERGIEVRHSAGKTLLFEIFPERGATYIRILDRWDLNEDDPGRFSVKDPNSWVLETLRGVLEFGLYRGAAWPFIFSRRVEVPHSVEEAEMLRGSGFRRVRLPKELSI